MDEATLNLHPATYRRARNLRAHLLDAHYQDCYGKPRMDLIELTLIHASIHEADKLPGSPRIMRPHRHEEAVHA